MDVQISFLSNPVVGQTFEEILPSTTNANKKTEFLECGLNLKKDALQAVKLDPAVLEAQITIETRKMEETDSNEAQVSTQGSELPQEEVLCDDFKKIVSMQETALLSLTPDQYQFLLIYAEALRRKRLGLQRHFECAFCKNNGESVSWYRTHALKDGRGRVKCPVLRGFRCPRCGATGDRAHTIKYCPQTSLE